MSDREMLMLLFGVLSAIKQVPREVVTRLEAHLFPEKRRELAADKFAEERS